jgi:AAA domain
MSIKLIKLGDLLSRPMTPVNWLWEGRLVAGTTSLICAKPKTGKSTLTRCLALAVARGEPFLGCPTKQGSVLYFSLEERTEDVINNFRAMGATPNDDIEITEAASVGEMVPLLKDRKPALLVVDPLFRLVRVRDGNAYAENYDAMGPLIDASRETGTHIQCCHHSSKLEKAYAVDAPIGSVALSGAASTILLMRRTGAFRTLQSSQRIGDELPETVLKFDPVTLQLSLGDLKEIAEVTNIGTVILNVLANRPMTEPEINEVVQARNHLKRKAVRELLQQGSITRSGSGVRGDPYKYGIACTLVPGLIENSGDTKAFGGVSEETSEGKKILVPIIHSIYGGQEYKKQEALLNVEEKLVPTKTENSTNSAKPGTSNSGWWSSIAEADTASGKAVEGRRRVPLPPRLPHVRMRPRPQAHRRPRPRY